MQRRREALAMVDYSEDSSHSDSGVGYSWQRDTRKTIWLKICGGVCMVLVVSCEFVFLSSRGLASLVGSPASRSSSEVTDRTRTWPADAKSEPDAPGAATDMGASPDSGAPPDLGAAAGVDREARDNCFQKHSFYVEVSGQYKMPGTRRTKEATPEACQMRCQTTFGCEHFSAWSDGGCLLTSYTAYAKWYTESDTYDVVAGPRSCSSLSVAATGPDLDLDPALGLPSFAIKEVEGCGGHHDTFALAWKAEGESFFDDWQFVTTSETHGAEWYLNRTEAFAAGVVHASVFGALLRVGDQIMPFKRRSVKLHSAQAWRPDKGFLVVMKYQHVPHGAGIWPAFWLMNSDIIWPKGGELDILEYANDAASKVTFHTDRNCSLSMAKLKACNHQPGMDADSTPSCYTNYTANALGCMPPQVRHTGKWFSEHPGVLAIRWDAGSIAVFHIPEAEIPRDLQADKPAPNTWDKWLLTYLPFDADSCFNVAKPQEIVINIALCGDWSGGAWWDSDEARATKFVPPYCIPGHVAEPATDCCTIFVSSPKSEGYLKSQAYFDIDYVKVFEPEGMEPTKLAAGTYRNGGVPLEEPCIPCGSHRWIPVNSPSGGNVCCPGCETNSSYYWNDQCRCGGTLFCDSAK